MADDGPLLDLLLEMARDAFPDLFVLDDEMRFYMPTGHANLSLRGVFAHPNSAKFAEALQTEPRLRPFSDAEGAFINSNHGAPAGVSKHRPLLASLSLRRLRGASSTWLLRTLSPSLVCSSVCKLSIANSTECYRAVTRSP
jgi:hypothetical protein